MHNVPQLYMLVVDKDTYLVTSWNFIPYSKMLSVSTPFEGHPNYIPIFEKRTIIIFKYPMEDGAPEFYHKDGKFRIKGRF